MTEHFEHHGQTYQIIDGRVKYLPHCEKKCIKHPDSKGSVEIKTAEQNGWIKKVEKKDTLPEQQDAAPHKANSSAQQPLLSGLTASDQSFSNSDDQPVMQQPTVVAPTMPPAQSPTDNQILPPAAEISSISTSSLTAQNDDKKSTEQDEAIIYFMPVDKLRAQVFLAHGLIYPSMCDPVWYAKNFNDCQTHTHLILFAQPPNLKQGQILLEILLMPSEINNAERDNGILKIKKPLPISRLVSIQVSVTQNELDSFIRRWINPDVPVPNHLFKSAASMSKQDAEPMLASDLGSMETQPDIAMTEAIKKFDRYMGVMAFWRNADRYASCDSERYADYPGAYLRICKHLLERKTETNFAEAEKWILLLLDIEMPDLSIPDTFIELTKSDVSSIQKEDIYRLSDQLCRDQVNIPKALEKLNRHDYRGAVKLLQEDGTLPEAIVLAALYYPIINSGTKSHETIKLRLHEDWPNSEHRSVVLATLGAFYGYTELSACDHLYSVHSELKGEEYPHLKVESDPHLKFHLINRFERRLIETLYQWAFHKKIDDLSDVYANKLFKDASKPDGNEHFADKSSRYFNGDLHVCRWITPRGDLLRMLERWDKEIIDSISQTGNYLSGDRFLDLQLGKHESIEEKGRLERKYTISKTDLIMAIKNNKFGNGDIEMLLTAVKIDTGNRR